MAKKYIVTLADEEREQLHKMLSSGTEPARKLARARILLKADAGWRDTDIRDALDVNVPTIQRVRRRCVEEGLEAALNRRPSRPCVPRDHSTNAEAKRTEALAEERVVHPARSQC